MADTNLAERVDRDPRLTADEKETSITMYGSDKKFTIFSAKPTIVKSLLDHDHFDIISARLLKEGTKSNVSNRDELKTTEGKIVAVKGKMPVGVLTIKSVTRANNHQSSIVSSETVDSSVFE
jgi:hypothetical protein